MKDQMNIHNDKGFEDIEQLLQPLDTFNIKVVEQAVKSRYETITMKTRIRENIALAESAGSGQSIFEYDPQSNGAKDYQALTEEIISRNQ